MRVLLIASMFFLTSGVLAEVSVEVKNSVERAMPFLEKEGRWWIEEKACVSCHHSTFLVWAKDLALQAGIEIDRDILAEQRKWVVEEFLAPYVPNEENENDEARPGEVNGDRNVEGVSQLLLSSSRQHFSEETVSELQAVVLKNREPDGKWKAGGQLPLQKRPKEETRDITALWAATATDIGFESGFENPQSTEWWAMSVIADPGEAKVALLLERQNEDGGWSWKTGEKSSPTATGQALWALSRSENSPERNRSNKKAVSYLIRAQAEDGRWITYSTKNRTRTGRISDFWGTAWAVIGMLESELQSADVR